MANQKLAAQIRLTALKLQASNTITRQHIRTLGIYFAEIADKDNLQIAAMIVSLQSDIEVYTAQLLKQMGVKDDDY